MFNSLSWGSGGTCTRVRVRRGGAGGGGGGLESGDSQDSLSGAEHIYSFAIATPHTTHPKPNMQRPLTQHSPA